MTPTRDGAWFRRKVRELGRALSALSPERRTLGLDALTVDAPSEKESDENPMRPSSGHRGGAYNAATKGNGR